MTLALTRTPTSPPGRCTPAELLTLTLAAAWGGVQAHLGHLELLDDAMTALAAERRELDADQAIAYRMPHTERWRRELAAHRQMICRAEQRIRCCAALLITGHPVPHRTRWVHPNTSQIRTGGPACPDIPSSSTKRPATWNAATSCPAAAPWPPRWTA